MPVFKSVILISGARLCESLILDLFNASTAISFSSSGAFARGNACRCWSVSMFTCTTSRMLSRTPSPPDSPGISNEAAGAAGMGILPFFSSFLRIRRIYRGTTCSGDRNLCNPLVYSFCTMKESKTFCNTVFRSSRFKVCPGSLRVERRTTSWAADRGSKAWAVLPLVRLRVVGTRCSNVWPSWFPWSDAP
jgi:hypothetical protein